MLRLLVLLLLIANVLLWAWQQGWLGLPVSLGPAQREPHRLQQQIHPERLLLRDAPALQPLPARSAPSAVVGADSAPATSPSFFPTPTPVAAAAAACLEAGPFTPDELQRHQPRWASVLPAGSWSTQAVDVAGLWLVYMGPYPDNEALQRKQQELRRLRNITFEEVRSPANLANGLSLGRYTSAAQADAGLESMKLRGIRSARVVNLRPPMSLQVVRVPAVPAEALPQLLSAPLPQGKGFVACRPAETP